MRCKCRQFLSAFQRPQRPQRPPLKRRTGPNPHGAQRDNPTAEMPIECCCGCVIRPIRPIRLILPPLVGSASQGARTPDSR